VKGPCLLAAILACLLPTLTHAQPAAAQPAAQPEPSTAKEPAATAPSSALYPKAFAQKPSPPAAPSASAKKGVDPSLALHARAFFLALMRGDANSLALLCKLPFHFESRPVSTPEELKRGWSSALMGKSLASAKLYDVELLTADEMIEKYGRPPERLSAWPLKGGMLSIANIDGHPVIVLWKKSGQSWFAYGLHD
jgi:hypothetical protein